jgi:hypothetical protein
MTGTLNGADGTNLVAIQEIGLPNPYPLDAQDHLAITASDGSVQFYLGSAIIQDVGPVFLHVGFGGISRVGGDPDTDLIYFGWGDAPLHGNEFGAASAMWDFAEVPEPGSFVLIAAAALWLRRQAR